METKMKKIFAPVLLAGALLVCFSDLAQAETFNAVRDERKSFVRSRSGECVRTRWAAATDLCRHPEAPKPLLAAAPIFRTVFHEDTRSVYFDFDDATLTPAAMYKLDRLAETLKYSKDIRRAEIIGMTDKMGDERHNMQLSGKRARAVEDYLNARGYWNTSVTLLRGVGSSAAIMDCSQYGNRGQRIQCNSEDRKTVVNVVYGLNEQTYTTVPMPSRDPTF
jgi:outer membrane protein OmpA-like peptidoglycan-associated protein